MGYAGGDIVANMRQIFTDTLIEMLGEKSLNEITVTDIANRCGVSRQSFYYYFNDIYDIVEWIFMQETEKALEEYSDIDTWQLGYIRLMRWAQKNKTLVMNTYRSVQREYIAFFMNRVLYQYILKVVLHEAKTLQVTQDQCEAIANFYTLAINAVTLDWIRTGMKEKPEAVAEKVTFFIEGDFKKALLKFQKKNLA